VRILSESNRSRVVRCSNADSLLTSMGCYDDRLFDDASVLTFSEMLADAVYLCIPVKVSLTARSSSLDQDPH
jgi:hypothetical protein